MQQITHKLPIGTLMFVEVPKQTKSGECFIEDTCLYLGNLPYNISSHFIRIDKGNWQLLGSSTDLSEEQLKEIMPRGDADPSGDRYVVGYGLYYQNIEVNYWEGVTALEAYTSLKISLGVVDVNPLRLPTFSYYFGEDGPTDNQLLSAEADFYHRMEQWQQAQQQVKSFQVLFKKD